MMNGHERISIRIVRYPSSGSIFSEAATVLSIRIVRPDPTTKTYRRTEFSCSAINVRHFGILAESNDYGPMEPDDRFGSFVGLVRDIRASVTRSGCLVLP